MSNFLKQIKKYLFDNKPENPILECYKFWDMSGDFPVPKGDFNCFCGGKNVIRQISWMSKSDSPSKYRCNISFKCTVCSAVFVCGVVVPKVMYEKGMKIPEFSGRVPHTVLRNYYKDKV